MSDHDDSEEVYGGTMGEPEERVVKLLHALRADRAPDQLRANVERLRAAPRPRQRPFRGPALGLGMAGALAAVLAAVVALAGSSPGVSQVLQAAALAVRGPVLGAPAPDREAPRMRLDRNVEAIYFPNWERFGWRATGQRVDRLDGRLAVTVYYDWRGRSVAYTILSSPAMRQPATASTTVAGTVFRTLHATRRTIVTWRRLGHTCVLSGSGVPAHLLYTLAAWHPAGSDY